MTHRQYAALISLLCLISTLAQASATSLEDSIGEKLEEQIDKDIDQDNSVGFADIQKSNIFQSINSNLNIKVVDSIYPLSIKN
jgi:hypothetical protein